MNNEIKQGDKVRVSKDAPRIYTPDWVDAMFDLVLKVTEVEDGNAMVEFAKRTQYRTVLTAIPCKYLVKVGEEYKPKFKKGDRVRNIESGLIGVVDKIVYENIVWVNGVDGKRYHWKSDELELVKPTEQTEASADVLGEFTPISMSANPIIGFEQAYWQEYEADLAKEVALKVANKFNDPKEAAEYAVSVAKAVVDGLKRK